MLLARYAPPGVLVNERMEILQFRGQTGSFLQPAPGEPQNNLIKMARPGLLVGAARDDRPGEEGHGAGQAERRGGRPGRVHAQRATSWCSRSRATRTCRSRSSSCCSKRRSRPPARVPQPIEADAAGRRRPEPPAEDRRLPRLEHELAATKEYLQSLIEEHGRTNDDLGSANEELVSGNEELQSMNEELETAKEELQSTNEELTTVNDELQSRNQEVTQVNSDLLNLLATVDIPIVILDRERRIRRFTPKAQAAS